jgi:putative iron-regulated protein
VLAIAALWLFTGLPALDAAAQSGGAVLETYAEIAYRSYRDAYGTALALSRAVDRLNAAPSDATLTAARRAWLASRPSYGQTEAFRFYGGPIDSGKLDEVGHAPAGLEGLLNAWPLNEGYIDAVVASDAPITRELLVRKNAQDDEADVTTGYHAIEYLLWGADRSADGPGDRTASDFRGAGAASRRRTYLRVATDLLVANLKALVDAWEPGRDNYRALLSRQQPATSLRNILTGIATLTGFELASERLGTALDSGSQEDEQSCFSDSTHVDILANALGVQDVYFGRYGAYQGVGLNALVRAANPDLNRYLEQRIRISVSLAQRIDKPFDRSLASPAGSPSRAKLEALVKALQMQADLLKQASSALRVPISLGDND